MRSRRTHLRIGSLALVLFLTAAGAPVALAQGATAAQDADIKEINAYRLTDAKLAKFVQATRNLAAAAEKNPDLVKSETESNKNMTLAQMAAFYDRHPPIKGAINSAGMTSREYVTFLFSMMQAGMMSWVSKQPGAKLPADFPKENVAFVDSRKEQLDKLQQEFQALDKRAKGSDADDEESDVVDEEETEADSSETPASL